jgi:hypothetical protein
MKPTNEIFKAIEKARGEGFDKLEKSGKNNIFKSSYSTLMDVFNACKKPLEDNGVHISYHTELLVFDGKLENILVCRLHHAESGEMLESKVTCFDDTKKGSQAIGSGITYMRRYLLQAMLNLECDPETDDDGNNTTVEPPKQKSTAKAGIKVDPKDEDVVKKLEQVADEINKSVEQESMGTEEIPTSTDNFLEGWAKTQIEKFDQMKTLKDLTEWPKKNKDNLDTLIAKDRSDLKEEILAYWKLRAAQLKPQTEKETTDG